MQRGCEVITNNDNPEPILWTSRQAAAALQVSERTLYQWTRDGLVPAVRISRTVRYLPAAILARMEQLQDNATTD